MAGLDSLPKAKWVDIDEQPILKTDFVDIETAILQLAGIGASVLPTLIWNDTTSVRIKASSDTPAGVIMSGFPDVDNLGQWVDAGLTDGNYRENDSNTDMDFDTSTTFWGNEKSSQWYAVFAVAGDSDDVFTLKAAPILRVSSQATQTITLRNSLNGANIGYGWATDSLSGYQLYFLSGSSKGLLREVSANNNDNTTGGTITYTGSALTVAAGDWFIALPSDTNFRWLGDFWNNSSGHIQQFYKHGHRVTYYTALSYNCAGIVTPAFQAVDAANFAPPLAVACSGYGLYNETSVYYGVRRYPNAGHIYPNGITPIILNVVYLYYGNSSYNTAYGIDFFEYPVSMA